MAEVVKPFSKGTARDRIFVCCNRVPFNTGTSILDPTYCKSFPYDKFYCVGIYLSFNYQNRL